MLATDFDSPETSRRSRTGFARSHLDGFASWLGAQGYAPASASALVRVASHFGCWVEERRLSPQELDETAVQAFRRHLRRCRCGDPYQGKFAHAVSRVRRFLEYLRHAGVAVPPTAGFGAAPRPALVDGFRLWMTQNRGVRPVTLDNYDFVLRDFLHVVGGKPERFQAHAIRAYVADRKDRPGRLNSQWIATALRMFLRYLIAEGKCSAALEGAVPAVARWRLSALPRYLPAQDVERVLATCDLCTPAGLRDRAVLVLLARLGLRAGDAVGLRLSDIDWQESTLRVSGKGRRDAVLPLPQEVGDALLAYLERGRPVRPFAQVFLRTVAPIRPWSHPSAVSGLVARAIRRAGVKAPFYGAHVLRHSVATTMLRQGACLDSIATLLRHRSIETTAVYAKVDVALLRSVAQPWPEVTPC